MAAKIGYFLSSEEHQAPALVEQAVLAERAGFEALWVSDHFHPWNDEQGNAPFVWATLGALSQAVPLPVTTAVTCPTVRVHPVVIAQAAATVATLLPGRFSLGVGTGEALNEHIFGDAWPPLEVRLDMLEEAVDLIREMWSGGMVTFEGQHYTVHNARLYSLPDELPPILVSAFGPKAMDLAGRIGDGYIGTTADADLLAQFDEAGGAGKPKQGGLKVCWGEDEAQARKTAHRLWANEQLPGQLSQDMALPSHFEAASQLVTEEMVAESIVCGNDVDRHVQAVQEYVDAGYTEVYVGQIGPEIEGFCDFYRREVLPRLR